MSTHFVCPRGLLLAFFFLIASDSDFHPWPIEMKIRRPRFKILYKKGTRNEVFGRLR